ncbi:MAG: hypothetical protein A3F84_18360, partial [Candidatus Handelsmanbacteria bacterium RIFCSPLOWO2_12_FULL_64_10]
LEDLMNIQVTSVSKKEQRLSQTAAAVHVITQEDIRHSGLTSIPEALRLAPGLSVARVDGNKWAITARGFNWRWANKLLVLIDGRSVYSPVNSGVYGELQDLLLEDLDRIEVIRGPGSTLWGANAVNGVINIITKHAGDTQGGMVIGGGGMEEWGFGSLRYGGKLGGRGAYRLYTRYFDQDAFVDALNRKSADFRRGFQGGFRAEWRPSGRDRVELQGDLYNGDAGERRNSVVALSPPFQREAEGDVRMSSVNAIARWGRTLSARSEMNLQVRYDRNRYDNLIVGEHVNTFDLDFQHRFAAGGRQDVVWGLGYRFIDEAFHGSFSVSFKPDRLRKDLFGAFAQDEIAVVKDRLRLTLGSKFERHEYTGLEVQPSARLLWTPHARHTAWAAASRAVRTPSDVQRGIQIPIAVFPGRGGSVSVLTLLGSPKARSENLLAYEFGYRLQPHRRLSIDVATFYNVYDHLSSTERGAPFQEESPSPPHTVIPLRFDNLMYGKTYGVEIVANWQATDRWRLTGGYSGLRMRLHHRLPEGEADAKEDEGNDPARQMHLRSSLDLPHGVEFNGAVYYMGRLANQEVPSYTRLDLRLGWRPVKALGLSVAVQNLLKDRHTEYGTRDGVIATQVERSAYGKITWGF